jgi:Tfp pilus assembly protein PilF
MTSDKSNNRFVRKDLFVMTHFFMHDIVRRSYLMFLLVPLIVFTAVGAAIAQGGVGSTRGLPDSAAGIHSIQGRVYLPNGRRAGEGISVRLEGNVMGARRAATDADGSFMFNGLPAADYSVIVDGGSEYESVRQSVVIYGTTGNVGVGRSGQTMQVDIRLLPKGSVANEEKLFAGVPKEAVDSYKKARQSAQAGNSKKAIEQLNSAIAIYPKFSVALSDLGDQYHKTGEMAKLVETMEALLKLTPNDSHAHLNMGIALYNQKKFDDAQTHLREAIKLNNADPVAHYYLGMTLVSAKQYSEAEKELEAAVANGGENLALAHKYLGGLYLSSKKNQQAADELEKYLKLDPKAADAERIKGTIKDLRSKQ